MNHPPLIVYQMLIDELCEARRAHDWKPENDRDTLELLTDIYDLLTDEEREVVESEGGRSWPDLVDAASAPDRTAARS